MQEEVSIECPFCGESITLLVDVSVSEQTYIEDCSVCCRPIQLRVRAEDGVIESVEVTRS